MVERDLKIITELLACCQLSRSNLGSLRAKSDVPPNPEVVELRITSRKKTEGGKDHWRVSHIKNMTKLITFPRGSYELSFGTAKNGSLCYFLELRPDSF